MTFRHLHFLRVSSGDVGRSQCLSRSARRQSAAGLHCGVYEALRARERRDLGLHQRAFVLLAETSLELPAQLRPIRKSRVATMADRALSASSEQERVSHLQKLWRTTADDVFELHSSKTSRASI